MEKQQKQKNVICLSGFRTPSVRLCGDRQLTWLHEQGLIRYRFVRTLSFRKEHLIWADVLIFVRSDDVLSLRIARAARASGKYCIYVLDDDLLSVPKEIASSEHFRRRQTKVRIRAIMRECQCFLSPSPFLLEKYGKQFERSEKIEEPALLGPLPRFHENGPVRIGFAGSADRTQDVEGLLTASLLRVLDQYGTRVEITFFGACPDLVKDSRVKHIPYRNSYDAYVKTMESLQWDIGLAPMPDSDFHRCKYFNKYIEYAGFGIAGIYSDVFPYRFAVQDGENGLLAPNDSERWYTAICRLIDDPALREKIRRRVREEAKTQYAVENTSAVWAQVICECASSESDRLPHSFDLCLLEAKALFAFEKLREWGWKTPTKLLKKLK